VRNKANFDGWAGQDLRGRPRQTKPISGGLTGQDSRSLARQTKPILQNGGRKYFMDNDLGRVNTQTKCGGTWPTLPAACRAGSAILGVDPNSPTDYKEAVGPR
jgi:hypothetical protein